MGAIEVERAGIASGVLNTARQFGAALGLAVFGSIAAAVARADWIDRLVELPAGMHREAEGLTAIVAGGQSATVGERLGSGAIALVYKSFVAGMSAGLAVAGGAILVAAAAAFVLTSRVASWRPRRRARQNGLSPE